MGKTDEFKKAGQTWITYMPVENAMDMLGYIPDFLDIDSETPAREQLDRNYLHGGGWRPMSGFTFRMSNGTLNYPGDPPFRPIASLYLPKTGETVVVFDHAFVGIFKEAKLIECARMD